MTSPEEAFNPDMPSPNDMMVDTEEHIVEPTANDAEKDSLTIINPDNLETETEQLQDLPRADDRTCISEGTGMLEGYADATTDDAIKELVLPPLVEEPKILSDTVFTWKVENWRQQNKKEHGPIFQAGGSPWYGPDHSEKLEACANS